MFGRRVMICQPTTGRTKEEILEDRNRMIAIVERANCVVLNTAPIDELYTIEKMEERGIMNFTLCDLAKSLEQMARCNIVCFCKGWQESKECRFQHEIAQAYGLKVFEE